MSLPLLELIDIKRSFVNGDVTTDVLKGISFSVEKSEYISIMGPSGCGKSTLLNLLGCLDRPSSGQYFIDGQQVDSLADSVLADIRNQQLGFVFQTFHLLRNLTAVKNVELPLVYRGISKKERRQRALDALNAVGLSARVDHFPKQMSGGEQQRVAIARSIVGQPQVLLADEPTGALDSKNSVRIMEIFSRLNRELKLTIVQVTHDIKIAYYGDKIIHMEDGEAKRIETVTSENRLYG